MPIGLVQLRRQGSLHVAGFDTNHGEAGFSKSTEYVLREHPCLQADASDSEWKR